MKKSFILYLLSIFYLALNFSSAKEYDNEFLGENLLYLDEDKIISFNYFENLEIGAKNGEISEKKLNLRQSNIKNSKGFKASFIKNSKFDFNFLTSQNTTIFLKNTEFTSNDLSFTFCEFDKFIAFDANNSLILNNKITFNTSKFKEFLGINLKNSVFNENRVNIDTPVFYINSTIIKADKSDILKNYLYFFTHYLDDPIPTILDLKNGNFNENEIKFVAMKIKNNSAEINLKNSNFKDNDISFSLLNKELKSSEFDFFFAKSANSNIENNFFHFNDILARNGSFITSKDTNFTNNIFFMFGKFDNFKTITSDTKNIKNSKFHINIDINGSFEGMINKDGNITKNYLYMIFNTEFKDANFIKTKDGTIQENNVTITGITALNLNVISSNNADIVGNIVEFQGLGNLKNAEIFSSNSGNILENKLTFYDVANISNLAKTAGDFKNNKFMINLNLENDSILIDAKNIKFNEISNCHRSSQLIAKNLTILKGNFISDNNISICNAKIDGNLILLDSKNDTSNNQISIKNSKILNSIYLKDANLTVVNDSPLKIGGEIIGENAVLNLFANNLKAKNLSGFKKINLNLNDIKTLRTPVVDLDAKKTSLNNTKIKVQFNGNVRKLTKNKKLILIQNKGEISSNLDIEIENLFGFEFEVIKDKNKIYLKVKKSPYLPRRRFF